MSVFISRANTTFGTLCSHLSLVQVSAVSANIRQPSQQHTWISSPSKLQHRPTIWFVNSPHISALLVGRSRDRFPVVSLGIFSVLPLTEPCALRLTQPLKVSPRDFSWGKGGRCVWMTNYHPCSAETSRKSGALNYPEPLGPPRPVAGDLYFLLFTYICYIHHSTHSK